MPRIHVSAAVTLRCVLAIAVAGCASGGAPEASGKAPEAVTGALPPPPSRTGADAGADATDDHPAAIFTSVQADRGRTAFDAACSDCHTTSEFRGRAFQSTWGRRTVHSFYRDLRSTMPDDNPGSLEEDTYLDVVSFILSINGHAAGPDELAPNSPMREVRMAPPALDP